MRICHIVVLWIALFATSSLYANLNSSLSPSVFNHILSLADIHFDPFFSCQGKASCPLIEKLRRASVNKWPEILTAYDTAPPQYRQDSNTFLLHSALNSSKKIADIEQVKFVLVLGDFLGHDFRTYYKKYSTDVHGREYTSFVNKTMTFLTNELARSFPGKDIYMVVGNNDSYQNDYVSQPKGRFFSHMSQLWSTLIKSKNNQIAMRKIFPVGGYYAITIPNQPGLRLIVLNTNFFSAKGLGQGIDKAANQELNWLHAELQSVRAHHQKAFIAMHIPIGIDIYKSLRVRFMTLLELWQPAYRQRFQAEIQTHAADISAIFTAHLHSDTFQILTFNSPEEIPVTGTPSISPIFGNNPGFKIYTYESHTFQLEDFVTYYYPLNNQRAWGLEYDFNRIYQPNCHDCPLINGMTLVKPEGRLSSYYKLFYSVSSPSSPVFSLWYPYYWCAIWKVTPTDYRSCAELKK